MQINIPQRLKAVRESRGLTQVKVAAGIGANVKAYQKYEEGRATPSIPTLMKLSNFYSFNSLDQLLGIAEEKEQPLFITAYHSADEQKRKIVDLVLNLNC